MKINAATRLVNEHLEQIVGQGLAKERLTDILLGGLLEEGFIAPILFVAPPGIGKTKMLRATRAIIKALFPARKTIYFETGKEMGTPNVFFEDVLVPFVHDKDAALCIDEVHEAGPACLSILRQMVEITEKREPKRVARGDMECYFNPCRHAIVIATNRIDLLDAALVSRFERIDLSLYTDEEMEAIIFQGLENDGVTFNDNTLRAIAACNRGSARDVIHWLNAIRRYLARHDKKTINRGDVRSIIEKKECYPMGVSKNELRTLLLLEKDNGQQLQSLANKNLCAPDEQKANERYLMTRGLIKIDGVRYITKDGRDYLAQLRADGYIPATNV